MCYLIRVRARLIPALCRLGLLHTFGKLTQMQIEHFALQFEKLSKLRDLRYSLGKPTLEVDASQAEEKLGVSFPAQVSLFYRHLNGLHVEEPPLEILPIEQLNFVFPNRLHFATLDGNRRLYFDTSKINAAEQWNVVAEDDYCVTLSMASFWSNKIFAWVGRRRAIWEEHSEWQEVCENERAT